MKHYYWTFILDDELFDYEFNTRQEAQDKADSLFEEQCEELDDAQLGLQEKEITLIRYHLGTDENGDLEQIPVKVEESVATYEYYHGDLAEHGTY